MVQKSLESLTHPNELLKSKTLFQNQSNIKQFYKISKEIVDSSSESVFGSSKNSQNSYLSFGSGTHINQANFNPLSNF